MKNWKPLAIASLVMVAGCTKGYSLVPAAPVDVAKSSIRVTPSTDWNKSPKGPFDIAYEENWTANGPLLDSIGFIGGLPDGKAIVKQRKKADQKVPVFKANMSPQDLVSMVESYYRIKAGASVFETRNVQPIAFVGKQGLQYDYEYIGEDQVRRRGRSVIAISSGKLYMMVLDGAAVHYFDAAEPEFDRMVKSATIS